MINLKQNLYITYSNQKVRDLKLQGVLQPFDKVITLNNVVLELFESRHFEIIIDEMIASAIVYKIIQMHSVKYFSYLSEDAVSLKTIYNFILKCKRNGVSFETLLSGEKLVAILEIDKAYQKYKKANNLVDIADVEQVVLESWESYFKNNYNEIYVDTFVVEDISYVQSKIQQNILDKLLQYKCIKKHTETFSKAKTIQPSNEVFDNIDEVQTAIRIARKLLEDGEDASEILIVASDIQEYAPLYKLFLAEYEMKGFSSVGTPLSSFYGTQNHQVEIALNSYKAEVASLSALYKKLGLTLSETTKENLKKSITLLDEKIGIEITEPNQIVGLSRRYKHIVFIGTDINHFPPKANDNFLYSYEDELKYFCANNYFTSSQTQLNELKRLSDNLYVVTASYSGKRELSASVLIGSEFDEIIDISNIKSMTQLALENTTQAPNVDTATYYESISSKVFSSYDGEGVKGLSASHLSASQINKYISCPLAYLYSNRVKLRAPKQDEEGFDVMEQGSLMHLCYELFGKYIKENSLKTTDRDELCTLMFDISLEAYEKSLKNRGDENIHHKIFLTTLQAGLQDEREAGLLAKFVDYYREKANEFEFFKNTEFEKEFALDSELKPYELKNKEDENYFIKGYIDRFDNLESHINIIDYKSKKIAAKSGKHKETQEKIDELKDIQLALYMLYAKQKHINKEYYSSMLSFKGESRAAHFGELLDNKFNDDYEAKVKKIVFDTKDGIENGKFGFNNGDVKVCEWCEIKNICHESVLNKSKKVQR